MKPNTSPRSRFLSACLCFSTLAVAQQPAAPRPPQPNENMTLRVANEVRRQIVTLPEYGLFDDISFNVKPSPKGLEIVLRGSVARPILKSSAENVTKKVEGVEKVTNQIEVQPLSRFDDEIRARVYVAIYRHPTLSRYNPNRGTPLFQSWISRVGGITNDPPFGFHPIHIIVKNGNVTLEGVVDNTGDSTIAEIQTNSVSGVFSVTNNLRVPNSHLMEMMGKSKAQTKK
ncbi:MAG: BON domain-containing protein [Acidobacteria bacterium]|nr:BON domain-containing protein [Acidobacteriota bacterium]